MAAAPKTIQQLKVARGVYLWPRDEEPEVQRRPQGNRLPSPRAIKQWPTRVKTEHVEGFALVDIARGQESLRGWLDKPTESGTRTRRWFYFSASSPSRGSSMSFPTLAAAIEALVPASASDSKLHTKLDAIEMAIAGEPTYGPPSKPSKPSARARRSKSEDPAETIPQRRRRLRAEARERQRETVPKLRDAIRELKAARKRRLAHCTTQCKRRKTRIKREAERAREKLRERIAAIKAKGRELCSVCRTNVTAETADEVDRVLGELQEERETIAALRDQARGLRSTRGQAGGRRAAELRAEALDTVRRDVADDPILAALWEKHQHQIRPKPRASLTESFLEWAAEHPSAIAELQAEQERQYDAEAEELLGRLRQPGRGRTDEDLDRWISELDEADRWLLQEAPEGMAAVPF